MLKSGAGVAAKPSGARKRLALVAKLRAANRNRGRRIGRTPQRRCAGDRRDTFPAPPQQALCVGLQVASWAPDRSDHLGTRTVRRSALVGDHALLAPDALEGFGQIRGGSVSVLEVLVEDA